MNAPVILYHRIDGDGEPLLLLNGVAMSVAAWEDIARQFAESFRVVRCDFRGQLMMPVTVPDVADHAKDVVALMDYLELDTAHLLGTSFGGVVATMVAGRHPDRVLSLTTVASAPGFYDEMADEVELWKAACRRSLDGGDRGHLSDVLDPIIFSRAYTESHKEERTMRRAQIAALPGYSLLDSQPFFKEFVLRCPKPAHEINEGLLDLGIIGGFEVGKVCPGLDDCLMFCVTEMNSRDEIDELVDALAEVGS